MNKNQTCTTEGSDVKPWHNASVKHSVILRAFCEFMNTKANRLIPYDNRHLKLKSAKRM